MPQSSAKQVHLEQLMDHGTPRGQVQNHESGNVGGCKGVVQQQQMIDYRYLRKFLEPHTYVQSVCR